MPPKLPYPFGVPELREDPATFVSERRSRRGFRRALNGLAVQVSLVLVALVVFQGSVPGTTPAGDLNAAQPVVALASATQATATVILRLPKTRTSTKRHARATVIVRPRASQTDTQRERQLRSLRTGRVKIVATHAGHSRVVRARLTGHKAKVVLPLLPKGVHRLRAVFLGDRLLARITSNIKRLTVVRGPKAACLSSKKVPGGTDPWGTCWPGPDNTGIPAGTKLTPKSGNQTISKNGRVVDGWDVNGCIEVAALNVTIKNSRARCITIASNTRARYCHYGESGALRSLTGCKVVRRLSNNSDSRTNAPRLTVKDSEIDCRRALGSTAIGDRNINVVRVDIHGCENGFDADSYMTIVDSYIHDLYNSTVGDPHTDGLQSAVGARLRLDHNLVYGFTGSCSYPNNGSCNGTSAINIGGQPDLATSSNTKVRWNQMAGGAYTMYCPMLPPRNFQITENYFSEVYSPRVGEYGPKDGCGKSGIISSRNKRLKY